MSVLEWDKDGEAFLGRICVGRVERVVPEDWNEATRPTPGADPSLLGAQFRENWRAEQRNTYEALQATPWLAAIIVDSDGAQDVLGHFATEEEAQRALAAEVEKAINR